MKELSDKTIALYEKNVSRIEDVVGDILDVKSVIKFIETGVSARGGKPFSVSTKRNLYTALIYQLILDIEDKLDEEVPEYKEKAKTIDWVKKQDLDENIVNAYVKYNIEQHKLNEILSKHTIKKEQLILKNQKQNKKDLLKKITINYYLLSRCNIPFLKKLTFIWFMVR